MRGLAECLRPAAGLKRNKRFQRLCCVFPGGEDVSPSLYYDPQEWHGVEAEKTTAPSATFPISCS